ncbi:hypothetical protein AB0C87_24775 [Actinomadura sp. NPDC048021]|uniref:hypothetical protein n=1 Tax=Actinomadura sp. NPDC048021 TaxID=3155385 RepID=UPI0034098F10
MRVWILSRNDGESGWIIGVYATKADARKDFEEQVSEVTRYGGFQRENAKVSTDGEGGVHFWVGYDTVELDPYDVEGAPQIAA